MNNSELKNRIFTSIIITPIVLFFIMNTSIYFSFFLLIIFLLTVHEWIRMNTKISLKIFGTIYLIIASYLIYLLRFNFHIEIFLLVIVICISTDLGGFIFGKTFKGPKLTKISPNKTYSGLFGSFFLSLVTSMVFTEYFSFISIKDLNSDYSLIKKIDLENISVLFVLFVSLSSQIGDLIISYFKRKAKIKDTGKFLPGHGGLLDRIDGIIFAMPISYIILILQT